MTENTQEVRLLTLTQPWASLVAWGEKRVETRSWRTSYRGLVAIHAAKGFPPGAQDLCVAEPFRTLLRARGFGGLGLLNPAKVLPLGRIVAVARMVECLATVEARARITFNRGVYPTHELAFGDYSGNRWGFILAEVQRLEHPLEFRGAQGMPRLRPATVAELLRRVSA